MYFCTYSIARFFNNCSLLYILQLVFPPNKCILFCAFHNRPNLKLIPSSSYISVRNTEKSREVNLIVGALTFHKDLNQLLKITCSVMEQHTNLDLDDKRPCPLLYCGTLLKMNGDLLKYSSSERRKQVWVQTE